MGVEKNNKLGGWALGLRYVPDRTVHLTIVKIEDDISDKNLALEMQNIALMMHNRRMSIEDVLRTNQDLHKDIREAFEKAINYGLKRINKSVYNTSFFVSSASGSSASGQTID